MSCRVSGLQRKNVPKKDTSKRIVDKLSRLFDDCDEAAEHEYKQQLAKNRVARKLMSFMRKQRERLGKGKSLYEALERNSGLFGDVSMMHEHIFESRARHEFSARPFLFLEDNACGVETHRHFGGSYTDFISLMLLGIPDIAGLKEKLDAYEVKWDKTDKCDPASSESACRAVVLTPEWVAFESKFEELLDLHGVEASEDSE